MASVAFQDLKKSFGRVDVLHGVSADIADGEFLVLVGPSGCGKSTLLRMVAGLEDITGGTLQIGGRVVNDVPPKQRDIAMVFQNYALYPHLSVAENMAFSLTLAGAPRAEKDRRVRDAAQILGLSELLDRKPRQLSGGQRQRVAMGRAIVRDPQVFLFDEPLSNLDAKLRVQMRGEIRALQQRLGTTAIYVTHDQVEAMTMADRIIVMNNGHVEQVGTPLELYDDPANAFVAGFIGSPAMNMIEGALGWQGDRLVVRTDQGQMVAVEAGHAPHLGRRVLLGVRPEHLRLGVGALEGHVEVIETTGAETQLIVSCGSVSLTALFHERLSYTVGDRVALAPDGDKALLFDAIDGGRLRPDPSLQ